MSEIIILWFIIALKKGVPPPSSESVVGVVGGQVVLAYNFQIFRKVLGPEDGCVSLTQLYPVPLIPARV